MTSPIEEKKEWEEERVISLIQAYKASPELWNNNSVDYKNRKLKIRSLNSIAEQFNTSAEEVRRKIHNLRCQFNAELRKIKKKSAEHNIEESLIYSEWKYFEQMHFLADVYIVRIPKKFNDSITSNLTPITKIEEDSSESDYEDYEEPSSSNCKTAKRRITETDTIFIANEHNVSKPTDDDHRIFGEYVASELRNLNGRNAKRLKLMIRKAILEVTEEEYTAETSVKYELNF